MDQTFKKGEYSVRELSYTNGIRIKTALNMDNLEVIRTPKAVVNNSPSLYNNDKMKT